MELDILVAGGIGLGSFVLGIVILVFILYLRGTLRFVYELLFVGDNRPYRTFKKLQNMISENHETIDALLDRVKRLEIELKDRNRALTEQKKNISELEEIDATSAIIFKKDVVYDPDEENEMDLTKKTSIELSDLESGLGEINDSEYIEADSLVDSLETNLQTYKDDNPFSHEAPFEQSDLEVQPSFSGAEPDTVVAEDPSTEDLTKRLEQVELLLSGAPAKFEVVLKSGLIARKQKFDELQKILDLCKRLSHVDSDYRNTVLDSCGDEFNTKLVLELLKKITEAEKRSFELESTILKHETSAFNSKAVIEVKQVLAV